jgi:hypothetical protein
MFCKRKPRPRSTSRFLVHSALAASFALVFLAPLFAVDRVKELQNHFDHETHAGGKVKVLEKLGEAQFDAATKAGRAEDYPTVAFTFEKYRDNVRAALDLLNKQEPDADRHSNGYRNLELQVRRGIREVEETLVIVPEEVRPPLRIVEQDLIAIDDLLIAKLFPRRTKDPDKVTPPPADSKPTTPPTEPKP